MPVIDRRTLPWVAVLALFGCDFDRRPPSRQTEPRPPEYAKAIPPSTRGTYPVAPSETSAAPEPSSPQPSAAPASAAPVKPAADPAEPSSKATTAEASPKAAPAPPTEAQEEAGTDTDPASKAPQVVPEAAAAETPEKDLPAGADSGEAPPAAATPPVGEPAPVGEDESPESETGTGTGTILGMPYTSREFENGLRAVVVQTDIPDVVSLQVVVRAGSADQVEDGQSGFAHFFENMLFQGTERYSAEGYRQVIQDAGAHQNAYTSDDVTNYQLTFIKSDLEKILEAEADRFTNLTYTEEEFQKEALAMQERYRKSSSSPLIQAVEKVRQLAFTKHPYRHTSMGSPEDIERMPERFESTREFYKRFYRPNNTLILLVGDLQAEATLEKVANAFGDWRRGDVPDKRPSEPPLSSPKYSHIKWDTPTQPWLVLGFRGPAFNPSEPSFANLDALATVAFSKGSPLYRKVVTEERWADTLWAWFPKRRDPGVLLIGAPLRKPEHAQSVRDAIDSALEELRRSPLDPAWVEQTKSRLRYQLTGVLNDSGELANALTNLAHFERSPTNLQALFESYAQLSPKSMQQTAQTYFGDERRVMVTLAHQETPLDFEADAGRSEETSSKVVRLFEKPPQNVAIPVLPQPTSSSTAGRDVRLALVPSPRNPLVSLSYVFTVGAAYDPPGKRGLAAVTAALLAEGGSKELPFEEIEQAMYPMAAHFDWQVDEEMIRFSGTVHRDNLDNFYALASSQLLNPGFREEDFERVKKQVIRRIESDLVANNDEELAKEILYNTVFSAPHPYHGHNLGSVEQIERLSLADAEDFYRRHFRASGVIVGIAGGYPTGFPERVTGHLAGLPAGQDAVLTLPPPSTATARSAVVIEKQTPGVAVSLGFPIDVKRGDEDWIALWLARSWLGEHRSVHGRLFQAIREERGMNYGSYAYIEYFPKGMFQLFPDSNLARRQQIFQMWLRPFRTNADAHFGARLAVDILEDAVEKGLTASEFEATRRYLQRFVGLLAQTQERQLGYEIDSAFYGIPEFKTYIRRGLASLTLDAVNAAIRRHLRPDGMRLVFLTRDAASMQKRLEENVPTRRSYDPPRPELQARDEALTNKNLAVERVTVLPLQEAL